MPHHDDHRKYQAPFDKDFLKPKQCTTFNRSFLAPRPDTPEPSHAEEIEALTERVEQLERLIKLTFNGHVLIDGAFVDVARATKSIIG